jgi:hypothetical protein
MECSEMRVYEDFYTCVYIVLTYKFTQQNAIATLLFFDFFVFALGNLGTTILGKKK